MTLRMASCLLALPLAGLLRAGATETEARVSIDVREAPVREIVGLLAELGGVQAVFAPDVRCALTLKMHQVPWLDVLDHALKACGLGREDDGGVLWVASTSRLREDAEARRRATEARRSAPLGGLALFRLSYAQAEAMAPLLERRVAPRGSVTVDPRTNTLVIAY